MELTTVWFGLVILFWTGYLVLEGFDFGVGILSPLLGKDDDSRTRMLSTIGPHWDGNEVWLVVAGGAMFGAFPGWYADFASANYLALLVILVALIVRGVALEWRGKYDDLTWRRRCDAAIALGSVVPPIGWGTALSGSMLIGLTLLALCVAHGWAFLRLKSGQGAGWFAGTTALLAFGGPAIVLTTYDLRDLEESAASPYGLEILTWATLATVPFVIIYQAWSYRVFANRLRRRPGGRMGDPHSEQVAA